MKFYQQILCRYPPINRTCPYPPLAPYPTQMPLPSSLPYPPQTPYPSQEPIASPGLIGYHPALPYPINTSSEKLNAIYPPQPTAPSSSDFASELPVPVIDINEIHRTAPYPPSDDITSYMSSISQSAPAESLDLPQEQTQLGLPQQSGSNSQKNSSKEITIHLVMKK